MRRSLAMIATLLLISVLTSTASAQDLRTYRGKEARVKSNTHPKVAKKVVSRIDRFCRVFQAFFAELGLEKRSDNKIVARVFNTYDEYEEFRDRDVGKKPWAAYWSASLNAIVLYNDQADHTLKHTLFHECFHQYLYRFTLHAPKWINEGLAEYFEGFRVEESGEPSVRANLYDLIVLQQSLKSGKRIPLKELVEDG